MSNENNVIINYKINGIDEAKKQLKELVDLEKQSISLAVNKDLKLWAVVITLVNLLVSLSTLTYLIFISK